MRLVARQPRLRLMLTLLTAQAIAVGSLDLLFVILAVTALGRPQAWAGYLNAAHGVGPVPPARAAVVLVRGRRRRPVLAAALLLSSARAALAAHGGAPAPVALRLPAR